MELIRKVFKTITRPSSMTYGLECWGVKKTDENKLNSAEMRMLRWERGEDHVGPDQGGSARKTC